MYDFFKKSWGSSTPSVYKSQPHVWLAAAASAELISNFVICPLETVRIRILYSKTSSQWKTLIKGMYKHDGITGFFQGLPAICKKQVPLSMVKFGIFEKTSESLYKYWDKKSMTKLDQLGISLGSSLVTGGTATLCVQLAASLQNRFGKYKTYGSFGIRCMMIGGVTAGQFFIYDCTKVLWGGLL